MNAVYILYQYNNCPEDLCNTCPIIPEIIATSLDEYKINELKKEWESRCKTECTDNSPCYTYKICFYFLK